MKILLAYYSNTGNVRRVAEWAAAELERRGELTVEEIRPRKARGYWTWLALSFLPGIRVSLLNKERDAGRFDLIVLGLPKWTLSCPPVNAYLHQLRNCVQKPVALWVCYGGFDQDRYMNSLLVRVRHMGMFPVAWKLFKRRAVQEGRCTADVQAFCREALSALHCGSLSS